MHLNANVGWLAVILLAALTMRMAAAVVWQQRLATSSSFAFPDSESYWELGRRIARGDAYEFSGARAFRTPGYPALLALLFSGAREPPVLAARVVGAVLGTATVGGIAWLTRKLFNERAMLLAALLAAIYLEAIAMSVLVLSEALFCPLMVGQLLLWTCAWRASDQRTMAAFAIGAGICAACAVLARPSWLLYTPLAVAVSFAFVSSPAGCRSRHGAEIARMGAMVMVAFVVTMSPWWIRNYLVLRAFVPTSTETGPSLYDGLHAEATGASDMRFVPQVTQRFDALHPELANNPTAREVALNRFFANQALAWARDNPGRVLQLAGIKLVRTWNIWPNEASLRSWPLRLAVAAGYLPLLLLGVVGAAQFGRRDFPYALCFLPAIYFSLLHMIFVGSIRYRQPAMFVLIVVAAGAMDWLIQRLKR
jgi:hypothetical protein